MKCLWDLCVCSGAGAVVSLWAYWTAESFPPDLWVLSPGPPPHVMAPLFWYGGMGSAVVAGVSGVVAVWQWTWRA